MWRHKWRPQFIHSDAAASFWKFQKVRIEWFNIFVMNILIIIKAHFLYLFSLSISLSLSSNCLLEVSANHQWRKRNQWLFDIIIENKSKRNSVTKTSEGRIVAWNKICIKFIVRISLRCLLSVSVSIVPL